MTFRFSKMHSLGNDFVIIDGVNQALSMDASLAARVADRKRGIGCDQILIAEVSNDPEIDFRFRIFNADGSESAQCGNGARCFARFLRDQQLTQKSSIAVSTTNTTMQLNIELPDYVRVNMGAPVFEHPRIPFREGIEGHIQPLRVGDQSLEFGVVSMGNPHAVLQVEDTATAAVHEIGAEVESHPQFPQRTNVGFMQVSDRQHIRLRVFERGVGETEACGSGACAAVVSGITRGLLSNSVQVRLPGGEVRVEWEGGQSPVILSGDAVHVFDGEFRS